MEFGQIITLKDGIAEISGLVYCKSGELVLANNNYGLVLNLQTYSVGAVFFSENELQAGSIVFRLYDLINIYASCYLLGYVANSMGNNYYFQSFNNLELVTDILDSAKRLVEIKAPGIIIRQSVYESLNTGIKVIDSIVPIGLGQRELVIGDRQTGKTSVVIDALLLKI